MPSRRPPDPSLLALTDDDGERLWLALGSLAEDFQDEGHHRLVGWARAQIEALCDTASHEHETIEALERDLSA